MAQGSRSPPREAELLDDDGLVDIALTDLKVELQAGGGGRQAQKTGEIVRRTACQGPYLVRSQGWLNAGFGDGAL